MNVATWYNTSVVGVNIDETQIAHAKRLAYDAHMEKTLQFVQQEQCIAQYSDSWGQLSICRPL